MTSTKTRLFNAFIAITMMFLLSCYSSSNGSSNNSDPVSNLDASTLQLISGSYSPTNSLQASDSNSDLLSYNDYNYYFWEIESSGNVYLETKSNSTFSNLLDKGEYLRIKYGILIKDSNSKMQMVFSNELKQYLFNKNYQQDQINALFETPAEVEFENERLVLKFANSEQNTTDLFKIDSIEKEKMVQKVNKNIESIKRKIAEVMPAFIGKTYELINKQYLNFDENGKLTSSFTTEAKDINEEDSNRDGKTGINVKRIQFINKDQVKLNSNLIDGFTDYSLTKDLTKLSLSFYRQTGANSYQSDGTNGVIIMKENGDLSLESTYQSIVNNKKSTTKTIHNFKLIQ